VQISESQTDKSASCFPSLVVYLPVSFRFKFAIAFHACACVRFSRRKQKSTLREYHCPDQRLAGMKFAKECCTSRQRCYSFATESSRMAFSCERACAKKKIPSDTSSCWRDERDKGEGTIKELAGDSTPPLSELNRLRISALLLWIFFIKNTLLYDVSINLIKN